MIDSGVYMGGGVLSAANMKFGVVVVGEFYDFSQLHLMPLIEELVQMGCPEQNIVVRNAPSIFDVVITSQFFAEYTDVDAVVILMPENRMINALPIMNGIIQLQMQWNMVVTVGGSERAAQLVEMVNMQYEMVSTAADNTAEGSIS